MDDGKLVVRPSARRARFLPTTTSLCRLVHRPESVALLGRWRHGPSWRDEHGQHEDQLDQVRGYSSFLSVVDIAMGSENVSWPHICCGRSGTAIAFAIAPVPSPPSAPAAAAPPAPSPSPPCQHPHHGRCHTNTLATAATAVVPSPPPPSQSQHPHRSHGHSLTSMVSCCSLLHAYNAAPLNYS